MFRALHITLLITLVYVSGVCQDPLPAVIEKDTILTAEGSPYYIQQTLSINSGITLKITRGTQIIISGGVSISNNGRLLIEGSETEKVLFTSDAPETRWNYITNQGSLIAKHLSVRRAVRFVSSFGDTVIIENCDVADTYRGVGDDCIGVHYAKKLIIRNTSLTGNPAAGKTDAIDLDGISGDTISGNIITGYSDDGIDIGTNSSNIVIEENEISFCDMGISIGENSTALVYKNLLIHSKAGIQSHTGAVVDARLNTLYGNTYGIRAFHNDGESTSGGTIYVSSSIISNSTLGDQIQVGNSALSFDYCLSDLVSLPGIENITGIPQIIPDHRFIHRDWRLFTGHFVVFFPKQIRPSQLQRLIIEGQRHFFRKNRKTFYQYFPVYASSEPYCRYLEEQEKDLYDDNDCLIEERLLNRTYKDLSDYVPIKPSHWVKTREIGEFLAQNLFRRTAWKMLSRNFRLTNRSSSKTADPGSVQI